MRDEDYMKRALQLARRGLGKVSPNPVVGAVIVRDSRIIGEGYHHRFGGSHAEVEALKSTREDVSGATLYVTLEPCCHYGKTPPCVDAIIQGNFSRVVSGTLDPNPQVNGKSMELLKRKGIETEVGVLEKECRSLNEAYFKYITVGMPLVTVKYAQTLDGRIATATGNSQWISSEESRKLAHRLRAVNDAVIVGVGTVLADAPELSVRLVRGVNPVRVILDSALRIPLEAGVLSSQNDAVTMVAATPKADERKLSRLRAMGIEVLQTPEDEQGGVDVGHLLRILAQRGISSVLVEGGAGVITSFLRMGLVDRLVIFIAPKVMGSGIEAVGDLGVEHLSQALPLSFERTYRAGEDLVIEARIH